jgi:hypothetical protein
MARPGRWTVAQLEAAMDGALAGASYKTVERLRRRSRQAGGGTDAGICPVTRGACSGPPPWMSISRPG